MEDSRSGRLRIEETFPSFLKDHISSFAVLVAWLMFLLLTTPGKIDAGPNSNISGLTEYNWCPQ
ncbi:UNVERIFIED_CONTAM: hypothetical protein NCL1_18594 [Trichonephila clavipes]